MCKCLLIMLRPLLPLCTCQSSAHRCTCWCVTRMCTGTYLYTRSKERAVNRSRLICMPVSASSSVRLTAALLRFFLYYICLISFFPSFGFLGGKNGGLCFQPLVAECSRKAPILLRHVLFAAVVSRSQTFHPANSPHCAIAAIFSWLFMAVGYVFSFVLNHFYVLC